MQPLNIQSANLIYHALVGVGGIGTGEFFALEGNHTLGREESRAGHFLDQRDYCKLHIITHYIQVLLGEIFHTIPIGRIGDDAEGKQLLAEMSKAGLDMQHVEVVPDGQTLFSFCFVYPDGSGGNMTTNDSVNATVDTASIDQTSPLFQTYRGQGIALAAPEVPLSIRLYLLKRAAEYDFFRATSLTSTEITLAEGHTILSQTDLLAINADEAAAFADITLDEAKTEQGIQRVIDKALNYQTDMLISITCGKQGSWVWDGHNLHHVPAIVLEAVNTAGAGDAHFAGLIVGLSAGLSLTQSQNLATWIGALSVLSPHTIHPTLDRALLKSFVRQYNLHTDQSISRLLTMLTNE